MTKKLRKSIDDIKRVRDTAPELLLALRVIEARIQGEFDNPGLLAFGPLSPDTEADCLRIARVAIAKAGEKIP